MNLSGSEKLMPQEEMLEVSISKENLTIGLPRETDSLENRISLVPNAVAQLVQNGHKVIVEENAGNAAHFTNQEYGEAGADMVKTPEEVYKADIILKVAPLTNREIQFLKKGQTIISSLQLTSQPKNYFKSLIQKKATAIAFEYIKDKSGAFPVLQSMSEVVGKAAIFIAAEYLSDPGYGKGNMFGGLPGVTPTEVVIIGAGTVGENAAKAALCTGANVKVFDNNIYKLRRLVANVGQSVFTCIIQPKVLEKVLKTADVVIGAVYSKDGITQCIISEEMIMQMKYGSIIIDVSIDQGGCFETSNLTTHKNPVFRQYNVTHYCVPNIASRYPHTASYALSNFFTPVVMKIGDEGGVKNLLRTDYGISQGTYMYSGILTNKRIGEMYDLPSQNIELLMAAFD